MPTDTLQTVDKYLVLENLGKGAKSSIFKVQDSSNGSIFTLKRVIKENEDDNRYIEQVETEYNVSKSLDNPFLRKSFELKKIRKWLKTQEVILVMEYVEGLTLKQVKPTDIEVILNIFVKVASGLESLHSSGWVHADIKPKNILLIPTDGIKIIDFGQSCPIGYSKERIQGTPDYMAPEQVDRGPLDQRTDVFNLGASMYWVLTNQTYPTTMPKQRNGDVASLSMAVSSKDVKRPDEINSGVPVSLSKLVMDCCNYNPKERPDNMREVIARIELSRHLFLKQKANQTVVATSDPKVSSEEASSLTKAEDEDHPNVSSDDTDDFDKFIESIL
jgi:serine/threonine-protein kinase